MDPVNFNFADPSQAVLNGIKTSAVLGQINQQAQDRQLALQQQQIAQQQAIQQQMDLRALAANPNATHADYARLMTQYPGLSENLGKAFKVLDEGQQQNLLNFNSRVYSAQLAGNNQLATDMLRERAKADPGQAQHYNMLADMIEKAPAAARSITALSLAGSMGPDKFAAAFQNLGTEARANELQPLKVAEATGQAQEALAKGGAAPTTVALGNEKVKSDLLSAEQKRVLDWYELQIKQANSETERGQLTLARDKFVADNNLKQQTVAQENQGQFDNITQSLGLVRGLQKDLSAEGWFGKWNGVGSLTGKLMSYIPGTDAKDFRAKLETLKSQQFLAQAKEMRGMGALSDAEGARIEKAVASLDPDQSPAAFKTALTTIEQTLAKGHAKLIASGKLPAAGGAFVMKHPQYGNVTDGDIQRLMAQNPGTTREQVLQFLRSTGGK